MNQTEIQLVKNICSWQSQRKRSREKRCSWSNGREDGRETLVANLFLTLHQRCRGRSVGKIQTKTAKKLPDLKCRFNAASFWRDKSLTALKL